MASSPLITWWGLLEAARASALVTTAGPLDNPQNALVILSRARRELQDFANPIKRVTTITIDGTTTDGSYGDPLDIKQPLEASIVLNSDGKKHRMTNISPEAMDQIVRKAQWGAVPSIQPPYVTEWLYTIDQAKVFIYPYQNVVGTMTIRYLPYCHEFQPSNIIGDWAGITDLNSLGTWMKANGPERELTDAAGGMSDYLAMDLMEKQNIHKAYPERYERLMANWQATKLFTVKNTPMQSKGTRIPRHMGVIR